MSNFTQRAIKETFLSLLEERPLSEITVKDIVEKCGINRNSFYYHFQDLPALLEEIIKEEADAVIEKYSSANSIVDCFDALVEFSSRHKRAIMHIYRSVSRDIFERYLMQISEYFINSYISTVLTEEKINDNNKKAIVSYYKCVCFGLVIDWLNNGMKEEYTQMIREIFCLKPDMVIETARRLKEHL